jgi:lysophospholipid acyltransferase (LPLAT)-like uncharacterized protein
VPNPSRWHHRLLAWFIVGLARTVIATLRVRWKDTSGYLEAGNAAPAIYSAWHNRLALAIPVYEMYVHPRSRGAGLAALVSASKDGGFLAAILERFKAQPVRGSTTRRGPQALLELTTWAERGFDLAITPDGPRGPCYEVQSGVMALAQVTGLPIVPFSCHVPWKIQIKSWDHFQIPLPFSRCEMRFGEPIRVSRDVTDDERNLLREELEKRMRNLSQD